jgi:hypothetical protein
VQNSTPRRRYPRARPDLRFVSTGGALALGAHGGPTRPVAFAHALVLTYCDGHHDTQAIAHAVAGSLTDDTTGPDAVHADVERIIHGFDQDGLLL